MWFFSSSQLSSGSSSIALAAGLLFAAGSASASALVDNGTVVTLDGISYYLAGQPVGTLGSNCSRGAALAAATLPGLDLFPMTLIDASEDSTDGVFDGAALRNITAGFEASDDVYQPGFLRSIYLRATSAALTLDGSSLSSALSDSDTMLFMTSPALSSSSSAAAIPDVFTSAGPLLPATGSSDTLPNGPYLVSSTTGHIFRVFRLYPDDHLAFTMGSVPSSSSGPHLSLPALLSSAMTKSVAVPSRLYSPAPFTDPSRPLSGLRLGVKDIFHVSGLPTSGGNRAYSLLYQSGQNATAPSVQRLLDLGAVLVGKMGTVQFANGDNPTADWVDFHCPFNPRGDGYQLPSGSSTGPGAGIAAYAWLDLAVGSDTGGSMRGPAGSNGVFGNRPSTGAVGLDEVLPLSPVSDTAGVFARSGKVWSGVMKAGWYDGEVIVADDGDGDANAGFPTKLYRAATSAPDPESEAGKMVDGFVARVAEFLSSSSSSAATVSPETINITTQWTQTRPATGPAANQSLDDFLGSTYATFISHDQWRLLGAPFFADYAAAHGGRTPYVNPGPLSRWTWGWENAGPEKYQEALRNISVFTEWYEGADGYGRRGGSGSGSDGDTASSLSSSSSCSEGLVVWPWSYGTPSYRDSYDLEKPTAPPMGWSESRVAVYAGAPEVVVPVGEVAYQSRVSGVTEYLPVTVAMRMARGCDASLARLVGRLEEEGVLREVGTGSRLFG